MDRKDDKQSIRRRNRNEHSTTKIPHKSSSVLQETESALHESEERYRTLFESANDALFLTDKEGRILDVNSVACQRLRYRREELLKMSLKDIDTKSAAAGLGERLQAIREQGQRVFESEHLRRDGSSFPVEVSAKAIIYKGEPVILGIARDITERKRIEDLNSRLAAIVESSDDAIIGKTLDGVITSWNHGAESMYGYSAKEAVGKSIAILIPADLPEELRRTLGSVRRGEAIQHYETRRRRKDGTIIDVSLTVSPVKDGSGPIVGASAIAQNITGRKKMEAAVHESEARYKKYYNLGLVGMVIETPEGGWIAANDRACEMFGYSREELVKKHWTELTHPDDVAKDKDTLYPQLLRGEIENYSIEKRFIRKDGQPIDAIISLGCTRDAKGKADQVFGFVVDITERKKAEDALRLRERQLSSINRNVAEPLFLLSVESNDRFRFLSISQSFLNATGLREDQIVDKDVREVIPEPSLTLVHHNYEQAIRENRTIRWEEVTNYPSGTKYGEVTVTPILDARGQCTNLVGSVHDITERVQAEKAVRESEEKFRKAFATSPDACYINTIKEGIIIEINDAFVDFFGYTREECVGKTSLSLNMYAHGPPDRARMVAELTSKGYFRNLVFEVRRKNGEIRSSLFSGSILQLGAKNLLLGVIRDVTEHKQLEEKVKSYTEHLEELVKERTAKLAESEERYRVAKERLEYVTTMNPAVVGISHPTSDKSDFYASFLSKSAKPVLGFEAEELVGKSGADFWESRIPVEDLRRFRAETPLLWRDGQHTFEYRFLHKDGGTRWIREEQRVIRDSEGNPKDVVGYWTDVTEEKKLEAEFRSAKEQLEHVIEFNPAVVYTAKLLPDFRMEVTYMSKNMVSLSGFDAEQFVGLGGENFWVTRVHPDDLALYRLHVPQLQNSNRKHWSFEYRFLRKDGVYRWIREEFNVVRDSTGNIVDLIGLWNDVTDRKDAEALEEKRKAELAKKLNDITDRVDTLTRIRENLKTVPDIGTGLDEVLESILWNFGLDCGAVLVFDRKTNTVNVRASKARTKELRLNQSYPMDVVELKDLQAKSITRILGEDERSILGTEVVHAIPIRATTEIYGALVLGNEKENSLEEEDKRILELYAELVYSFMIEKSMSLTPVLESRTGISSLASSIEPGEMYLFKKKNQADALEVFTNIVFAGREGLCISRMYPPKIRSKYDLQKTPIVWLTNEAAEGEQCVHSIQDISIAVGDFLERAQKAVVLIDGFEYLITNHGFESFLRFLQILKTRMQGRNGILLASIFEQALAPRELALIEREMQPFGR